MRRRSISIVLALAAFAFACSACGGGPRAATADLVAVHQPTPDPTLDAVVRDLPHTLAGVAAPTPTSTLVVVATLKPKLAATTPKSAATPLSTPRATARVPAATAAATTTPITKPRTP